jgi:hypothetical protein
LSIASLSKRRNAVCKIPFSLIPYSIKACNAA